MATHPERRIGRCLLLLVFSGGVPSVAAWVHTHAPLPPGYGAEGDRRRANPVPALVRPAVEELSAGADGSWVKECVQGGNWVYELHVSKDGQASVVRLDSTGTVIQPGTPELVPRP